MVVTSKHNIIMRKIVSVNVNFIDIGKIVCTVRMQYQFNFCSLKSLLQFCQLLDLTDVLALIYEGSVNYVNLYDIIAIFFLILIKGMLRKHSRSAM